MSESSTENGSWPAHPSSVSGTADGGVVSSAYFEGGEGLTKREYFAAQALKGLLASGESGAWHIAQEAFKHADAMLEAAER